MAETSNKWFFDMIGDTCSDISAKSNSEIIKHFFDWLSKLFKWELNKETTEKQKELNELATDLINENIEITDQKIREKITKLEKDDKKIDAWFEWIDDIEDEDFKLQEQKDIISKLQKESDNKDDKEDKEIDLDEEEFNKVAEFAKKKKTICENVLNSNDDKFKALPDNLKTKKEIIDSCNNVLKQNDWDIDKVTEVLIIEDLEKKQTTGS